MRRRNRITRRTRARRVVFLFITYIFVFSSALCAEEEAPRNLFMSKRTLYTITAAPQLAVCVYGLVMIPGILATEEGAWLLNALAMPLILAPFLIGGIGDLLLVYPDPHPVPKKESRQRLLSGWIYCIEGTFALGAQIIAAVDPNIRRCSVTSFTVSSVIAFFGLYRIIWNKQPPWFKNEIAFAPYMKADSIGAQWYRRF